VLLHFLALKALSRWSVQFGYFRVCCSSTHGAPRAQPFVKVGDTCPRAHEVGANAGMENAGVGSRGEKCRNGL